MCASFNEIANCDEYLVMDEQSQTNFSCKKCDRDYLLDPSGYKCIKRDFLTSGCLNYEISEDRCQTCKDNYFISTDRKECIAYP